MTSPTDKIPQDVRLAAISALMVPEHEMVDSIARALMDRDERAAKIADDLPHCELQQVSPSAGVSLKMAFGVGASAQAKAIASAIRGGS